MSLTSLLSTGETLTTEGARSAIVTNLQYLAAFLKMHQASLWGDLCDEDKAINDNAVKRGAQVISAYRLQYSSKIWIITEAERSSTAVLLPVEY